MSVVESAVWGLVPEPVRHVPIGSPSKLMPLRTANLVCNPNFWHQYPVCSKPGTGDLVDLGVAGRRDAHALSSRKIADGQAKQRSKRQLINDAFSEEFRPRLFVRVRQWFSVQIYRRIVAFFEYDFHRTSSNPNLRPRFRESRRSRRHPMIRKHSRGFQITVYTSIAALHHSIASNREVLLVFQL